MAAHLATYVHVHTPHGTRVFGPGDVVPTEVAALITNPEVWADQPEPEPVQHVPDQEPGDSWTLPQLREYAAREHIDLDAATKKADVLAVILAARTTDDSGAHADPAV
ncbi:MAG: hypothetical protein JWN03_1183 [Nocardia sp.]|uniref:hypothetical protein n=1 Tax=Nocardia sp. TaxID=1821 RepID=UPI0026045BB9|nr:hypothetical protein [Nocardia sp.]MCU1640908.1 hypothetical protein [Nocardia sp.]